MTTPKVDWQATEPLLVQRDRFTRAAIREEFEAQPDKATTMPVEGGLLATPVADDRYTVIWKRLGGLAQVKAVVASRLYGEDPHTLREKLQRVLQAQSHGLLTLD